MHHALYIMKYLFPIQIRFLLPVRGVNIHYDVCDLLKAFAAGSKCKANNEREERERKRAREREREREIEREGEREEDRWRVET